MRGGTRPPCPGQMEAVDRIEEEQRAHALVEVVAVAPKPVEGIALGQQVGTAQRRADFIQAEVAHGRVVGLDDCGEISHDRPGIHRAESASSCTSMLRTWSRSLLDKARAICACNNP